MNKKELFELRDKYMKYGITPYFVETEEFEEGEELDKLIQEFEKETGKDAYDINAYLKWAGLPKYDFIKPKYENLGEYEKSIIIHAIGTPLYLKAVDVTFSYGGNGFSGVKWNIVEPKEEKFTTYE